MAASLILGWTKNERVFMVLEGSRHLEGSKGHDTSRGRKVICLFTQLLYLISESSGSSARIRVVRVVHDIRVVWSSVQIRVIRVKCVIPSHPGQVRDSESIPVTRTPGRTGPRGCPSHSESVRLDSDPVLPPDLEAAPTPLVPVDPGRPGVV